MPFNFYLIILAQLIIFLCIYFRYRDSQDRVWIILSFGAFFGLVYGVSLDIIFGALGIFTYTTNQFGASLAPWGLLPSQLIQNGLFSYGLLVATVYFFVAKKDSTEKHLTIKLLTTLALLTIATATVVVIFAGPGILSLFASGVVIMTASELILILRSQVGPVLSFLIHRDYKQALHLWAKIMIVGFLCEVMNNIFPFWVFLPGLGYPQIFIEVIIVIFGYVVLVYPMIIFWMIIKSKKRI